MSAGFILTSKIASVMLTRVYRCRNGLAVGTAVVVLDKLNVRIRGFVKRFLIEAFIK